jgi:hypothetical protein
MKRPKRSNYPNGIYGDIDYVDRLERYTSYIENKLSKLHQPTVIIQRELLLDFAEYSENDKKSEHLDELVDNYLDSIKQ